MVEKQKDNAETVPNDVLEGLEPLAKALNVAVSRIWNIFTKRYLAKGVAETFTAVSIAVSAYTLLHAEHTVLMWIAFLFAKLLMFDAIQLLINPSYFALEDIIEKVADEKAKHFSSSRRY